MIIDILVYGLLAIVFFKAVSYEYKDSYCPAHKSCDKDGAGAFSFTYPTDTDTCETLIEKIKIAATAEQGSIKWRKSLVLSMVIVMALLVILIAPGTIPSWKTYICGVIISFIVLYFYFDYYSYHVFGVAEKYILQDLKALETRCLKTPT